MSHKASAWAMEQKTRTPLEKLTLLILADCHNAANGRCFPSISLIAERAMCTRRGAMKAVESLLDQNLITSKKTPGKSTFYAFNFDPTSEDSSPVNPPSITDADPQTGEDSSLVNTVHPCTQFTSTGELSSTTGELSSTTGELSSPESGRTKELTGKVTGKRGERPPDVFSNKPIGFVGSAFCPDDFDPDLDILRRSGIADQSLISEEIQKFKVWEFKVPVTDWNKKFAGWCLRAMSERKKPVFVGRNANVTNQNIQNARAFLDD